VFEDEFGLSYAEPVSFTWAPKGKTPQLKRITKFRREISTMVGLTISGKIYKRHFEGSINTEKLLVGLEHLVRQIKGPFILIWDRSPTHRGKAVKAFWKNIPIFIWSICQPMRQNSIQKSIATETLSGA